MELQTQIPIELQNIICSFMEKSNLKFMNLEIYKYIDKYEKSQQWKNKYLHFFEQNKITLPPLNCDYNWKNEYVRIINYKYWNLFDNVTINKTQICIKNSICKSIPKEIGNLRNLDTLIVSHARLKYIPLEIGNLKSLKLLFLDNNQIKKFPNCTENLSSLTRLSLMENQIKKIPNYLKNMHSLTDLHLDHNLIKKIPNHLCNLEKLSVLSLNDNKISKLSKNINNFSSLEWLQITGNPIVRISNKIVNTKFSIDIDLKHIHIIPKQMSQTNFRFYNENGNLTTVNDMFRLLKNNYVCFRCGK